MHPAESLIRSHCFGIQPADILDMAMQGKVAMVEAIEQDPSPSAADSSPINTFDSPYHVR